MSNFKYKNTPITDLIATTLNDGEVLENISITPTIFSNFTDNDQGIPIGKVNQGDISYITTGDIGYKYDSYPIPALSTHRLYNDSGTYNLDISNYNKISGVLVGGTYGGAGGGGGTHYATGGAGGPGGNSQVITFSENVDGINSIFIQIAGNGNFGYGGNGNNEGNAGWGGLSNFNTPGDGISSIEGGSNLQIDAIPGARGGGGYGPNQGEEGNVAGRPAGTSTPSYSIGLDGDDVPITVNKGKAGNGGGGGGYRGGPGGDGQVGQAGYGLIFLQMS